MLFIPEGDFKHIPLKWKWVLSFPVSDLDLGGGLVQAGYWFLKSEDINNCSTIPMEKQVLLFRIPYVMWSICCALILLQYGLSSGNSAQTVRAVGIVISMITRSRALRDYLECITRFTSFSAFGSRYHFLHFPLLLLKFLRPKGCSSLVRLWVPSREKGTIYGGSFPVHESTLAMKLDIMYFYISCLPW